MIRIGSTLVLLTAAIAATWSSEAAQQKRASPHETISEVIGGKDGAKVSVTYGRPLTKDRKIWGTLVPWGQPWRAGADEATTLETNAALMIGETMVPAGKYTLYMIPDEKGTTKMAISKKTGQWGIPVDVKNDLARVDMKKTTLDKKVDQFTIAISPEMGQPKGELKMMWETTQFSVPFTVKK
jgi:hypothetical protein